MASTGSMISTGECSSCQVLERCALCTSGTQSRRLPRTWIGQCFYMSHTSHFAQPCKTKASFCHHPESVCQSKSVSVFMWTFQAQIINQTLTYTSNCALPSVRGRRRKKAHALGCSAGAGLWAASSEHNASSCAQSFLQAFAITPKAYVKQSQ